MTRRTWIATSTLVAAALAAGMVNVGEGRVAGEVELEQESHVGLNVAPMPLDFRGKDRFMVGLGSYIVNVQADCNGCHSTSGYLPGGDPFRGQPKRVDTNAYLRGGQSFGPFVSRNLRPEIGTGLPAGLTYAQFSEVMRTGIDLDHQHPQFGPLLQVMPWPAFQNMTELDLQAVYQYLHSLPPVPAGG